MAKLVHEYWEGEDGAEFSILRERNDAVWPIVMLKGHLIFCIYAASWHHAMQLQYDRRGLGTYDAGGIEDIVYTDEDAAEQQSYLARRNVR
jgi:hypothetical protein